jgi:hypothetical protein
VYNRYNFLLPGKDGNLAANLIRSAFLQVGVSSGGEQAWEYARQIMMLPQGDARYFRDDITVIVILLNNGGWKEGSESSFIERI